MWEMLWEKKKPIEWNAYQLCQVHVSFMSMAARFAKTQIEFAIIIFLVAFLVLYAINYYL